MVALAVMAEMVQPGVVAMPVQLVLLVALVVPAAQVVIPPLPTAPATPNGSATPSTGAEVLHDTSTELALNKDGSLRVTRNFVVNVATK